MRWNLRNELYRLLDLEKLLYSKGMYKEAKGIMRNYVRVKEFWNESFEFTDKQREELRKGHDPKKWLI